MYTNLKHTGGDFDGTSNIVDGINDVSAYPVLIEAMMRRGATDEQVRKLVGENILRVWRQNEIIAARLQGREGEKPSENKWEGRREIPFSWHLPIMIPGLARP